MRFPVPLSIEIPDGQLAAWAAGQGVPCSSDVVRAKDAVAGVRAQVLAVLRADFEGLGVGAEIAIKGV